MVGHLCRKLVRKEIRLNFIETVLIKVHRYKTHNINKFAIVYFEVLDNEICLEWFEGSEVFAISRYEKNLRPTPCT